MTTAAQFLTLSPTSGVRYSGSTLDAYGYLDEHQDTHGLAVWTTDGIAVFTDRGVTVDNTYYGERTTPCRID